MTDPEWRRPGSRAWQAAQSLWLLGAVAGGGCLSGAPLAVIGLIAARRAWWLSSVAYTVVSTVGFFIIVEADPDSAAVFLGMLLWLGAWLGSVLHSALVNPAWLRHQRGSVEPRRELRPPPAPSPGRAPTSAAAVRAGVPSDLVPDTSVYYGESGEPPLDINTATVEQFTALPGLTRRTATRLVKEREARGGFLAVSDIVEVARLAPHEYARLRALLTCVPRSAPDHPAPGTLGRVVDV